VEVNMVVITTYDVWKSSVVRGRGEWRVRKHL